MKPCKSCPFRRDAPRGLWHPAHYLGIAYLGSADVPGRPMGCHRYNRAANPQGRPSPPCGGWTRAAPHTITVRRRLSVEADPAQFLADESGTMDAREMAEANGLDVARLPPLTWTPDDPDWPDWMSWMDAVQTLRAQLLDDPDHAWEYVRPGSPLDIGVDDATIRAAGVKGF